MKIKRNVLIWMIVLAFAFTLSACGNRSGSASTSSVSESANAEITEALETEPETSAPDLTESNILVAYFSNTGTTKKIAQQIAESTGADLAEIQRAEEYGNLYEEAEAEILDGVHPEITVSVEDISGYDTVFVGYPIWWDEAPAMIASFLAGNDFAGKTIVPFCTSASDSIDNSLHIFSELCPDAVIEEGLTANDLEDIEPWLNRLGTMENASGNNILIAYFTVPETDGVDTVANASRVATEDGVLGNTEFIATEIQKNLGGDLFAIEAVQEYPGTHDPLLEFAYNEKSDDARPELSTHIENLDSYDYIFIGYPNWNADLPMPLYTFFEEYDFTGKTIIPFVTHGGSGFSSTIRTIQSLEPDATIVEAGLSISRNSVATAQDDVKEWTDSLLAD